MSKIIVCVMCVNMWDMCVKKSLHVLCATYLIEPDCFDLYYNYVLYGLWLEYYRP